ncbi:sodium-coupled neutral amino acid transporter 9 homolog [Oppia nitens]|uniref:sodium-coupled neutral amino acid transporter 9 homolog n=1 Tax=Oppia nitens TaxID=1686743 RepID=UPI0023DC62E5|nr:sodium-coupled neutral amino acid transporter 9 homolog [Oppia nitens]
MPTISDIKSGESSVNSLTPLLRSQAQEAGQQFNYMSIASNDFTASGSSVRRPFHYPPDQQNVGQLAYGNHNSCEASVTYNRYRYYSRLSGVHTGAGMSDSNRLQIPDHVIPWYFYIPRIAIAAETTGNKGLKQSSFVTIFAIWNILMGTSLLCLPWALHRAGLLCGLLLLVIMTGLCFYTANIIISIPHMVKLNVIEFSDAVHHLLGRFAHILSLCASLITLIGGCIVYWVLMSNFLEHIITFVYQVIEQNETISTNMSEVVCNEDKNVNIIHIIPQNSASSDDNVFFNDLSRVVPFLLAVLMAPIISLKSANFFMKFNVVGSVSVIYLLMFAAYKSFKWGPLNVEFTDTSSIHYTKLFDWNFSVMSGILCLALFVHNCVISLLRTNRNQQNNRRDLGIAYLLVSLTYLLIASFIYIGFPIDKNCLKDNFLDNFQSNDILAFITRAFLLLQVFSLYPLLVLMLRIQVMHLLIPNTSASYLHILFLNVVLISVCVSFALFYPHIGTIIRYCGSFSALVYIFSLPPLAYIKAKRMRGEPIPLIQSLCLYLIIIIGFLNFFAQFIVA